MEPSEYEREEREKTGGAGARRVLCIVGSRKPAPGVEGRSAAREMLRAMAVGVQEAGAALDWLDLRELELPFFDGRSLPDYHAPDLFRVEEAIRRADVVILSVPAYWNGPSGVVKNLLDVLGGAAYDMNEAQIQNTCMENRLVGLLVVGSDESSAHHAHAAMRVQLASMGAWVPPRVMVIGNPRHQRNIDRLLADLKAYGTYLARLEVSRIGRGPTGET